MQRFPLSAMGGAALRIPGVARAATRRRSHAEPSVRAHRSPPNVLGCRFRDAVQLAA